MEISNETPIKKTKRLTSVVWNHFERVRKADICYAVCVHCNKKLSGSSNSGTTHLRNHLIRCLKRSNYDVSQILSAKRKRKDSNLTLAEVKDEALTAIPIYKFDQTKNNDETSQTQNLNFGSLMFNQERSRLDLARMIMLHGYPLSMVEDVGFKVFVRNLQPLFEVMPTNDIEFDCMTIYEKEKHKIVELLHKFHGRISLAVDIWTSFDNSVYLCLTASYIDEEWKLQKKMLNFSTLDSSNTEDRLSEVVIECLTDWGIDHKLFSMTFDDCSTRDDTIVKIKEWLSQNKPLLKNGELFDMCCGTHVMKSMARDLTESFRDVISKIRETVRHMKSSQANLAKFNEIAKQIGVEMDGKNLLLDCSTRWDSTYLMIESALVYRNVFATFQGHDSAISETEWEWAATINGYMKLLVEVTNVFSGNKRSTSNIYFPEICDVHIQLIEWCKNPDDFVRSVASKIKTKFDKYWSKCNLALAIAAILDPRYKMKLVEYYYSKIYESNADDQIKVVFFSIRQLFNEYSSISNSLDVQGGCSMSSSSPSPRDRLKGFDKFLHETSQNQTLTSDLEKYFEEPVFPRNHDFNVLNWWKVHTPRYPILSIMARDVLAIPASTLPTGLAFSTVSRVLETRWSCLSSNTRQALICGQDWLRMESEEVDLSFRYPVLPLPFETDRLPLMSMV